jgi:hypothetical protein
VMVREALLVCREGGGYLGDVWSGGDEWSQ